MVFSKIDEKKFDLVPFPKDFDKEKVFGCKQYLAVCSMVNKTDNSEENWDEIKRSTLRSLNLTQL
jgi:hypothetical protein